MKDKTKTEEKKSIYFARTYRKLRIDYLRGILYMLFLVLPCLVFLTVNLKNITMQLSGFAARVLDRIYPGLPVSIAESDFSILSSTAYIQIPDVYPSMPFIFMNLIVSLAVLVLLSSGSRRGKPMAIFFMLVMFIHIINCIYFLFAEYHFPYGIGQFSDLYIKQQIGIWLTFTVLAGIVTGFFGRLGYFYKVLAFIGIMLYSVLFGAVRYVLFLCILYRFSLLYMALMFFVFGPLFDFLYFVSIYSFLANKLVKLYDSEQGRKEWKWA